MADPLHRVGARHCEIGFNRAGGSHHGLDEENNYAVVRQGANSGMLSGRIPNLCRALNLSALKSIGL
jgi:hypothetical protein